MGLNVEQLKKIVDEEAKILPDQAPLEHFVHHNNLHHYETQKFEDAVENIFLKYGKTAYMPLSFYRKKYHDGEILNQFFTKRLNDNNFDISDQNLIAFIRDKLHSFKDHNELLFLRTESLKYDQDGNLVSMNDSDQKLWERVDKCNIGEELKKFPDFHVNRSLDRVNKILIPFLSVMIDQGQAGVQLKDEQRSMPWEMFKEYLKPLLTSKEFLEMSQMSVPRKEDIPEYVLKQFLSHVQDEDELRDLIKYHFQSIPGWAGMVYKVSKNKEVISRRDVFVDIYYYLLFRLFLQRTLKRKHEIKYFAISTELQIKENVFFFLSYYPSDYKCDELISLFTKLDMITLRRIFQQAYEDSYQSLILTGLQKNVVKRGSEKAKFQMFFCIDDREESFRRYLEETSSRVETYGVAGFFGLDMMYQKINEKRSRRYCPPAATPAYIVREEGSSSVYHFANFLHETYTNFFKSLFYNFILSPLKSIETNLHLYFPREKRIIAGHLNKTKVDKIHCYNNGEEEINGLKVGYTLEESAQRVAGILKGSGLIKDFSSYVVMIGHGHDSYNNPHVSAYRCGACSGANAAPNAKIFAIMTNDPRVRKILRESHGLDIPDSTYFIGGFHDTCNDRVDLFDIDSLKMNQADQDELNEIISTAQKRNAKERCRKFYQVAKNYGPEDALKFVEKRAWHVAEPRPELNHATNALCIVGKRELTKDVFLDRKAFLVSYDPLIDHDGALLAGLLKAVIPVCAGINLEYYFSKVDTENYGSGSKTSHNVSGFIGVINGIRGDLRTGLVWQMVEYHDPLRILFVIESTEDKIFNIMANNSEVKNLIENKWIALALINPNDSKDIKVYRDNSFKAFDPLDLEFKNYSSSMEVPTGLKRPVHFAYIGGQNG